MKWKYLKIKDPKLQKAVDNAWRDYGDRMLLLPATLSGRHHPPDDAEVGGMVKHIDKLAWVMNGYCKEFNRDEETRDILNVCAFFHDIGNCDVVNIQFQAVVTDRKTIERKHIITRKEDLFLQHPKIGARIAEDYLREAGVDIKLIQKIRRIIESHMSHWYENCPDPLTPLEKAFAFGDYLVSRKEFKLEESL